MTKFDIPQVVTDKIITAIENDPGDWTRPWVSAGNGRPFNGVTNARYNGVNVLLLGLTTHAAGYAAPIFASYKQWQKIGAQVRKGEQSTMVVYCGKVVKHGTDANGEETTDKFSFLKYSNVFNADQVDGFEVPAVDLPNEAQRIANAETFVKNTGAVIREAGAAYYRHGPDDIGIPALAAFKTTERASATENYYSTLFHELTHWTGPKHRLDRDMGNRFGDDQYAMEELIAEIGAAFICAGIGIRPEPRPDHAQYLAHWLGVLKADKKAIFTAASKAQEATDYLEAAQPIAIAA